MASAASATFVAELLPLPVVGMEVAEVGSADDCDEVAGPTAAAVVVDPDGAVVGAVLEVLELVVVVVVEAAVVVGAVVVAIGAVIWRRVATRIGVDATVDIAVVWLALLALCALAVANTVAVWPAL